MSVQSHVSLIDLSKQFKFEIDEEIKKKICFDETLVVSCAHYEGTFKDDSTDSKWSCSNSSETKLSQRKKSSKVDAVTNLKELPNVTDEVNEEESDFHFYFFPDCDQPIPPNDDKASLIIVDGFPKINKIEEPPCCTCEVDRTGKCPCHLKVPCECGAKKKDECTCDQLENICLCDEIPQLKCKCKPRKVCMCYSDGKPRPTCTCGNIDKPCICHPDKYPFPICVCNNKVQSPVSNQELNSEGKILAENEITKDTDYCECQKPAPKPTCRCKKGKECLCIEGTCLCDMQSICICDPTEEEVACEDDDSKTICSCPIEPECKCYGKTPDDCACFQIPKFCICDNAENCICFSTCECKEPCLCDMVKKENICVCEEKKIESEESFIEESVQEKKIKKVRAGKHGYRWCHVVDPKHTFFDFAYNRHKQISYKEKEKQQLKILGLYEEPKPTVSSSAAIEKDKVPVFKKEIRKPSIDCCSAVGGISLSVETLGEDKDKFLVQVVSNASKEGAKTGSKLISIIDCNLHTLEENRTEHITKKDLTKAHRSYMTICESGYYNKVTRICGERHFVKRLYHSFEAARNFLLEGANVVLLRYFAISRFCGRIATDTVLINGIVCESVYVCLGVSQSIVNGKPLFVSKVERHIIEPSGFIHQTLTVLTLRGYLVSHEWADSSYIFHINPLLRVVPERDEIEPHEPLREKWRNDLQLLSDYLDFKSTRSAEGARYVTENGELSSVIRDYLQALLLLRPHDALHFTRHYFSSALSSLDLPHNEYFDPCSKRVRYYFFEEYSRPTRVPEKKGLDRWTDDKMIRFFLSRNGTLPHILVSLKKNAATMTTALTTPTAERKPDNRFTPII